MESTILHVAIDSFAIQAERLRCPKLVGRPLALAPFDSPRPRVAAASREARAAGIYPGTPLVVARRLCRDLIALPPDPDLYAGLSDSIRAQLSPFAPFAEEGRARASGHFVLDLTGITRTQADARDRAAAAGRGVERSFHLHPTLGIGATRLVSRVAASVLAPDGNLLDVLPGSEVAFLAPLAVRVLPSARERAVAARLDLLNIRAVRDAQALSAPQLLAAFGAVAAAALWREARGLDAALRRAAAPQRTAVAEETLSQETNDGRVLAARLERLIVELGLGLRSRGAEARTLAVSVSYVDGREGRARQTLAPLTAADHALRAAAIALLDRAVTRRVRVRRLRVEAWEAPAAAVQLSLFPALSLVERNEARGERGDALETALDRVRARFGTEALVPAAWMAHGLVLRPSARP
jgi:DNA polymerase-4